MAVIHTIYIPQGTYNISNPIIVPSGYTWNGATVVPIVPTQLPLPGIAPNQLPIVYVDFCDPPEKKVKPPSEGCTCIKCGEFYPYAEEPEDGKGLVCYGCKIVW